VSSVDCRATAYAASLLLVYRAGSFARNI